MTSRNFKRLRSCAFLSGGTGVCGANMSWRDIVGTWLSNKKDLWDLIRCLVETNIPETLVDNSTLQSILLTQIMLETLNGISVPKTPQGNNFAYLMNAKEMLMLELGAKNAKHIK